MRNKLSDEKISLIKELSKTDLTNMQIAKLVGCSETGVFNHRDRINVRKKANTEEQFLASLNELEKHPVSVNDKDHRVFDLKTLHYVSGSSCSLDW